MRKNNRSTTDDAVSGSRETHAVTFGQQHHRGTSQHCHTTASREVRGATRYPELGESLKRVAKHCYGTAGSGNKIIHGENLSALHALAPSLGGTVKCVYIDPPYNNQERYRYYDDDANHEQWLRDITERLAAIKPLLSQDGSLWISIDDREVHYLKVAADCVFGRDCFVTTVIWEQRTTRENRRVFSNNHEYLLVYSPDPRAFKRSRNQLNPSREQLARYKNPDQDPRGPWQSVSANVQDGHATAAQYYELVSPTGRRHRPPEGRCWIYSESKMRNEIAAGNVWFGKKGDGVPRLKRFLNESNIGLTPETLWRAADVGTNDEAKKQLLRLFPRDVVFETPKPERLIGRILQIASDEDDLVLDAYLGSGTTAAVAHKMGRQYVGIESGDHAVTHCAERLKMVVRGEETGISEQVAWAGGGGFDFYRQRK